MLLFEGIRIGRRKKRPRSSHDRAEESDRGPTSATTGGDGDRNAQAANLLRQSLLQGNDPAALRKPNSTGVSNNAASSSLGVDHAPFSLVSKAAVASTASTTATTADPSLEDLVREERATRYNSNYDEARGILRHYKHLKTKDSSHRDSDEETEAQLRAATAIRSRQQQQAAAESQSGGSRVLAALLSASSSCWWWHESSRFPTHRVVARGAYLYLVWAPPPAQATTAAATAAANSSAAPMVLPMHLYLVPLSPATSLRNALEDNGSGLAQELWEFQTRLETIYASSSWSLVFAEVATTTSSTKSPFQAKWHVLVLPRASDFSLYLHQAWSAWQNHDDGGHKRRQVTATRQQHGLNTSVPRDFPYLFVDYESSSHSNNNNVSGTASSRRGHLLVLDRDAAVTTIEDGGQVPPTSSSFSKRRRGQGGVSTHFWVELVDGLFQADLDDLDSGSDVEHPLGGRNPAPRQPSPLQQQQQQQQTPNERDQIRALTNLWERLKSKE